MDKSEKIAMLMEECCAESNPNKDDELLDAVFTESTSVSSDMDTAAGVCENTKIESGTTFFGIHGCALFINYVRTIYDKMDIIETEYNNIIIKLLGDLGEKYISYIVDKDFIQEKRLYCFKIFIDALTAGTKVETCIGIVENSFQIYDVCITVTDGIPSSVEFNGDAINFDGDDMSSFKMYCENDVKTMLGETKKSDKDYTKVKKKKRYKRRLKVRK